MLVSRPKATTANCPNAATSQTAASWSNYHNHNRRTLRILRPCEELLLARGSSPLGNRFVIVANQNRESTETEKLLRGNSAFQFGTAKWVTMRAKLVRRRSNRPGNLYAPTRRAFTSRCLANSRTSRGCSGHM